jgi:serine/threonine protein kinase
VRHHRNVVSYLAHTRSVNREGVPEAYILMEYCNGPSRAAATAYMLHTHTHRESHNLYTKVACIYMYVGVNTTIKSCWLAQAVGLWT